MRRDVQQVLNKKGSRTCAWVAPQIAQADFCYTRDPHTSGVVGDSSNCQFYVIIHKSYIIQTLLYFVIFFYDSICTTDHL